jgi:hypothetical protein
VGRSLLLVVVAVAAMSAGGCRFWYKPVPVANAIGEEETVLAGDSVKVYRSARFEVYGPNAEAVYDGYEQLNRAYRAFERYFDAPAPRLAVVLSNDSTRPIDSETLRSFRERGYRVLRYVRPRSYRSPTRYGGLGYGGVIWPVAPTAARAMLGRYVNSQLPDNGERSDAAVLALLPLWYRAAIIHLIGEAGAPANDLDYVREKRGQILPLQHLLTLVRPVEQDSLLDPSRRNEADELTRIIASQSSTFARFLAEREGPSVVGRIGRDYLRRRALADIIGDFRSAPKSVPELERRWRSWIDTRNN